jgi:hypothetical protein
MIYIAFKNGYRLPEGPIDPSPSPSCPPLS